MGPGVQPKRTKIRKRYGSISYAPSKQQHERCHKGKWTTSSKQKAKACLRRQTSYQDIVSHSQRFTILRITITSGWRQAREPCCSGNEGERRSRPNSLSIAYSTRTCSGWHESRMGAGFSSAFRLSNSRSTFFHSRGFFLVTNGFSRSA